MAKLRSTQVAMGALLLSVILTAEFVQRQSASYYSAIDVDREGSTETTMYHTIERSRGGLPERDSALWAKGQERRQPDPRRKASFNEVDTFTHDNVQRLDEDLPLDKIHNSPVYQSMLYSSRTETAFSAAKHGNGVVFVDQTETLDNESVVNSKPTFVFHVGPG